MHSLKLLHYKKIGRLRQTLPPQMSQNQPQTHIYDGFAADIGPPHNHGLLIVAAALSHSNLWLLCPLLICDNFVLL